MKVGNDSVDPPIIESIAEARHLPSESQLAVHDPIVNLLIGVLRYVFACIQGGHAEFIGVALSPCAVTAQTNSNVDLMPVFNEGGADRLQNWRRGAGDRRQAGFRRCWG